ncbi:hypothetical protein G3I24_48460 [Micromonospora aurantiaca]|nr:hypothetical protein [Micromonospora aurantiaca]
MIFVDGQMAALINGPELSFPIAANWGLSGETSLSGFEPPMKEAEPET